MYATLFYLYLDKIIVPFSDMVPFLGSDMKKGGRERERENMVGWEQNHQRGNIRVRNTTGQNVFRRFRRFEAGKSETK